MIHQHLGQGANSAFEDVYHLSAFLDQFNLNREQLPTSELEKVFEAYEGVRPARPWYMLLAGLLTRAVLEGYLSAGWRGVSPVEVLLGVGLGRAGERESGEVDGDGGDDEFREFEPDGMPRLREAIGVLFPGVRGLPQEEDERAYEVEMRARLALVRSPYRPAS